jgi:sugar O-acyltransferase (sialic acid O-acetyltransferase NeuD family)
LALYLYGGGGHAKSILDILFKQGRSVSGIVVDVPKIDCPDMYGIPVYSSQSILEVERTDSVTWIVAIGDNHTRWVIAEKLTAQGYQFATAIHPSAQIGIGATIAPGTVIMANAVIKPDTHIGRHAIINSVAAIGHDCDIASYVHVGPASAVCGYVNIDEGVLLGVGTRVKPSMKIGAWTVCGAGSVVIKSLPSNIIAFGCPAKEIRKSSKASKFTAVESNDVSDLASGHDMPPSTSHSAA